MKTLLFILVLSISVTAQTLKMSDYCTPNDGLDDGPCMQTLVDDVRYGGTVVVDNGTWDIKSMVNFGATTYANNSIKVKGDKGAVIKPDFPSSAVFYTGNNNHIIFEDLVFVGDGVTANVDAGYLILVGSGIQARVTRCQFFGIRTTNATVYAQTTEMVVENSLFHGSSAPAVIEANNAKGLTVIDTEFFDYGNFNGAYYSKTPAGNGAWVKVTATAHPTPNAMANRGVRVINSRFDEGAVTAIHLTNIKYAYIDTIAVNVSGTSLGAGIRFDNVRLGTVLRSTFGYAPLARPAIVALNDSKVKAEGITLGASVFDSTVDGTSDTQFSDCDGC